MTQPEATATTAAASALAPVPVPAGAGSRRARSTIVSWGGLVPFFAFLGLFLVLPTIAVFVKAFQHGEGSSSAMTTAMTGVFRHYFWESIKLSMVSALTGGLVG